MKSLSLILPIYNVEDYIPRCLDSIYLQGLDEVDFEVIAIVDGSPDNSLEVVSKYSERHSNLIVIDKENGGVSSARNKGIEIARGEYIMFVDPDDTLMPGTLCEIHETLKTNRSEIFILRSYSDCNIEQFEWKNLFESATSYSGLEVYENGYTRGGVWGVVYNRQFLLNYQLEFPLNIKNSEDAFFFMKCQIKAEKIQFLDINAYLLYTRPGSASQDMSKERLTLWFNTLDLIERFKKEEAKSLVEKSMADGLVYSIISDITKNAIRTMGWSAKNFMLKHGVKQHLPICKENVRRSKGLNYIMKRIINLSYDLYFSISYMRLK